jgi:hypothetical protein
VNEDVTAANLAEEDALRSVIKKAGILKGSITPPAQDEAQAIVLNDIRPPIP